MDTSAEKVNPHRVGMALGGLYGLWHLIWSLLVLVGLAKPFLDFILSLHFLRVTYAVGPFNALKALGLIVVTSALGYFLGYVLAWLWNRVGVAREKLVR
jgi:hypothetical protein